MGSLGVHNCLGLAKSKKARILIASTSEVYGDPEVHPQHEEYWGNVNPVGPRGVYDEAKRFQEAMTMAYHTYHDVETRIIRIFNTYGPRMRLNDGRALPAFIGQALRGEDITIFGDGSQTRSFCYIDDDNNMVDITDKIPYRLLQFVKKTKFLFGDDIILDRALVKKHNEDIYEYLIEKAYEREDFLFKQTRFKTSAKEQLLIAFNKLFFTKFDNR